MQFTERFRWNRGTSRTLATIAGGALLTALAALPAAAANTVSLADTLGPANSAIVAPGDPITFNVVLTTDRAFNGFTYLLETDNPAHTGVFSITGRTKAPTNPLEDDISTNFAVTNAANRELIIRDTDPNPNAIIFPRNGADLGYSNEDITVANEHEPAGTYAIATLTLVAANRPGTYNLRLTSSSVITDLVNNVRTEYRVTSNPYTVTVVPEPGTAGLAATGLAVLGLRRRRNRAAE